MRASVVVLAVLLALTGCAGPAESRGDGPPGAPGGAPDPIGSEGAAGLTEVRVFADEGLRAAFDQVEMLFEAQNPSTEVVLTYGEGIDLARQIAGGEPAEVFATEDPAAMTTVTSGGKAVGEAETLAGGQLRIVTVSEAGAPFSSFVRTGEGSRVLIDTGVLRP